MQEYIDFFTNNMFLSLTWLGLFVALVMNLVQTGTAKYKEITPSMLSHLVNREQGVVIDLRARNAYEKGHIAGAISIQPSAIKQGELKAIQKYKLQPIIVVCQTGQTARSHAQLLNQAGFEKVYVLSDGLITWNETHLPLISGRK